MVNERLLSKPGFYRRVFVFGKRSFVTEIAKHKLMDALKRIKTRVVNANRLQSIEFKQQRGWRLQSIN